MNFNAALLYKITGWGLSPPQRSPTVAQDRNAWRLGGEGKINWCFSIGASVQERGDGGQGVQPTPLSPHPISYFRPDPKFDRSFQASQP